MNSERQSNNNRFQFKKKNLINPVGRKNKKKLKQFNSSINLKKNSHADWYRQKNKTKQNKL